MYHTAELIAVGTELLLGNIFYILGRNESALRKCFAALRICGGTSRRCRCWR